MMVPFDVTDKLNIRMRFGKVTSGYFFFLCVCKCVDVLLLSLDVSTVFILYDVALVVVVWLKQNRKKIV